LRAHRTAWAQVLELGHADPYPVYRRLRDEAPVYYNDCIGFYGLSRYDDVVAALRDVARLTSAKGDILEVVKAEPVIPPAVFINEGPPSHTIHQRFMLNDSIGKV
jgi:cytochrome P450